MGPPSGRGGPAEADVVLAPALAVDTRGRGSAGRRAVRPGAGGTSRPGAQVVALVFPEELYDAERSRPLPSERHDRPVDAVATPAGVAPLR